MLVSAHSKRFSAATEGRIGTKTAKTLLELVDQLTQIDSARFPNVTRPSRTILAEAARLLSELKSAANYAAKLNPAIRADNMKKIIPEEQSRSAAAILFALDQYVRLLQEHKRAIGGLLPATIVADAARVAAEYKTNEAALEKAKRAAASVSNQRTKIIGELQRISSDVRALAAVLFRREPELARQFALPRRRTKKRAAVAAPAEG
jgi:hypothetical protein